jgi:hypothetical protein
MFVSVLHKNGRADAEELEALVKRTVLMYRNGMVPPFVAVLAASETLAEANVVAAKIRSDRRKANALIDSKEIASDGKEVGAGSE